MNLPFLLKPAAKDYLWGGSRLNDDFSKGIEVTPVAETWECSTHPDGMSMVQSGDFKGIALGEVIKMHPGILGEKYQGLSELPILIKLIDAKERLSVQVHPDDAYAFENEGGQRGKTEMWYVIDAAKDSWLIYGLKHKMTPESFRKAISEGTLEKNLQKIPVEKDDIFKIEPGTIHAIGSDMLIAEVQESSNLTYRIYDYDRVDSNGKPRELHIDKAIDVANLGAMKEPKQPIRVLNYSPGVARELLSRCKYFEVFRMLVNTERRQEVFYQADKSSYRVLLCIDGCGSMRFTSNQGEEALDIYKGDCIFVPADSVDIKIHGKLQFLDVRG